MLGLTPECCTVKFKTVHCQIYQFIFRVAAAHISTRLKATLSVKSPFLTGEIVITFPMTLADAVLLICLSFEKRIFSYRLIYFFYDCTIFHDLPFFTNSQKSTIPCSPAGIALAAPGANFTIHETGAHPCVTDCSQEVA